MTMGMQSAGKPYNKYSKVSNASYKVILCQMQNRVVLQDDNYLYVNLQFFTNQLLCCYQNLVRMQCITFSCMQAYHFSLCFVYQKKFSEKYNIYFSCSGSFTGEKCDVELCDDASYCKNGGTCTFNNNHTGNKACQCAPGYTGMSIQINFSNVH